MEPMVYLLNFTVSGIKNIEDDLRLDFYKKTVDKKFDSEQYRVKAIYGENGSGKTGIVLAVKILKALILEENYLSDNANRQFLYEVINKKSKELHLECEYIIKSDKRSVIYHYAITLKELNNNRIEVIEEYLSCKNANYSASKYEEIFHAKNGEIVTLTGLPWEQEAARKLSANLISQQSFVSTLMRWIRAREEDNEDREEDLYVRLSEVFMFGVLLNASLEEEDKQQGVLDTYSSIIADYKEEADSKSSMQLIPHVGVNAGNTTYVDKKDYKYFKEEVKKLEEFIRIFKPDLISIDIEKKEWKAVYECSLLLNYGDYRVSREFESTGINKLIRLFDYLKASAIGKITFIDEMDSNINDIYLVKIIEYFMLYGKGQLCFTTHNTGPMEVLRRNKKSIDFLSSDGRIIPWRTNGNFAPEKLYRHGMIEYLPFNVEAEDFIGVLGD